MSWAGSDRAIVYLGVNCAGVVLSEEGEGKTTHWLSADSAAAACEQAMQLLLERPRHMFRKRGLHVRLSGALARPFLFQAVEGLKSWKEASEVAATLAPEATGLMGPCAIWLDDWQPGLRCVAVALALALREQIEQITGQAGFRVTELRPWWAGAIDLAQAWPEGTAKLLVARDTDSLTVFTSEGDVGYSAVATYAPGPAPVQARALVTRAALAGNIAVDEIVSVGLGGTLSIADGNQAPSNVLASLMPTLERWT